MTIDLYKSYKKFYDRWYSKKSSPIRVSMKNLARDLVKYLHENRSTADRGLIKERGMEMAELLLRLEMKSGFENIISAEIIEALNSDQFIIEVPYPVARRWNTEHMIGHVYIMTSKEMPGLSKLGATMMDLEIRLKKYQHRYGYGVDLYFAREFVGPFRAEKSISDQIIDSRLYGKNEWHTNEWYKITPAKLKKIILLHTR